MSEHTRRNGELESLEKEFREWEGAEVAAFIQRQPERKDDFTTIGGFPLKRVYTALDVADIEPTARAETVSPAGFLALADAVR